MRKVVFILALLAFSVRSFSQCDPNGILLELQATTGLNGLLIGDGTCLSTAAVSSPLSYSGGVLSITAGAYPIVRDSSLTGWGTTASPLGIRGYGAASNGQVPSKSALGITWITPGGATNLTFSGSSSPVTLNSDTGTDVTFTAAGILAFSATSGNITMTATEIGTVSNFSAGDLAPLFTTTEATTTTTPALSFSLNAQTANTHLSGPVSGGPAAPTFRSLVAADIPALSYASPLAGAIAQIPYFNTTSTITTEAGSGANSFTWDATNNRQGIATATPLEKIHVVGNILYGINSYGYASDLPSESDVILAYNALSTTANSDLKTGPVNSNTLHPQGIIMGPSQGIRFFTSNSWPGISTDFAIATYEKMRLHPDGSLTIGTVTATARVNIVGPGATSSTYDLIVTNSTGTTATATIAARSDGLLGVGTNAPTQQLHVAGSARVTGAYYDSSNSPGTSGYVLKSTATGTSWVLPSTLSGLNGIYSGSGSLPAGGSLVTEGSNSLRFLTNTASGQVRDMIRMTTPYNADDAYTNYLSLLSPTDSLHISAYDGGTVIQEYSGNLSLVTDQVLVLQGDSIQASAVGSWASVKFLYGENVLGTIKKLEGTETGMVPYWNETASQWEPHNPNYGSEALKSGTSETITGDDVFTRVDANSNAVALTLGSAMYQYRDYWIQCSRNGTNLITFTAEGGYSLKWDTDGSIPGDATVAVGSTGTGFQEDHKLYIAKRIGTIIYIK